MQTPSENTQLPVVAFMHAPLFAPLVSQLRATSTLHPLSQIQFPL